MVEAVLQLLVQSLLEEHLEVLVLVVMELVDVLVVEQPQELLIEVAEVEVLVALMLLQVVQADQA